MFDRDRNGKITVEELGTIMRNLLTDKPPSENELQDMVKEVDMDEDGTINFQEFLAMMAQNSSESHSKEELLEAFDVFDKNNDGFIDREELKRVMDTLDQEITDQEAEEMINECDINGDGKVDYHEFVKMMNE